VADPDVLFWPLEALTSAFARRDLSPVEVTEVALRRVAAFNDHLNAYLHVTPELAFEQAVAAEKAYAVGAGGHLPGVPISIKDFFSLRGAPPTFGSLASPGN